MQGMSIMAEASKGSIPGRGKSAPTREEEASAVMSYKYLNKISGNLHPNNQNNQLERKAQPPRDVPLDAQSWTQAPSLSSRVVAVTTVTYTS